MTDHAAILRALAQIADPDPPALTLTRSEVEALERAIRDDEAEIEELQRALRGAPPVVPCDPDAGLELENAELRARVDALLLTLSRVTATLLEVPDLDAHGLPPEQRTLVGMARMVVERLAEAADELDWFREQYDRMAAIIQRQDKLLARRDAVIREGEAEITRLRERLADEQSSTGG